jgi:hypothetical protein
MFVQGSKKYKTMKYWISDFDFGSNLKVISEDDYFVRPRPHVLKRRLEATKNDLKTAKRIMDMALKQYTERIRSLEEKITDLENQLAKEAP